MSDQIPRPPIRRATEVPRAKGPGGHITRLRGGQSLDGTICSPKLHGFFVHFNKLIRRSEACFEDPATCPGCQSKLPQKTLWYLYLWCGPNKMEFVELTDGAARQLERALAGRKMWRGTRVRIERTRSDQGRLNVTVHEYSDNPDNVPADHDPSELLRFLWSSRRTPKNAD
jgi:hypothetical protein